MFLELKLLVYICLSCSGSNGLSQLCFNWKMVFWFFPSFIEGEKWSIFTSALHVPTASFSFIRTFLVTERQQVFILLPMTAALWLTWALIIMITNPGLLSVLCDHYLRHFTAISNISLHCISLVFPFIRTLEFAQVLCTACITSRVANPIAEVRQEDRGTHNGNRKPIRAKYWILHRQEIWSRKALYLQEKNRQHQKVLEVLISSAQLGSQNADIIII